MSASLNTEICIMDKKEDGLQEVDPCKGRGGRDSRPERNLLLPNPNLSPLCLQEEALVCWEPGYSGLPSSVTLHQAWAPPEPSSEGLCKPYPSGLSHHDPNACPTRNNSKLRFGHTIFQSLKKRALEALVLLLCKPWLFV